MSAKCKNCGVEIPDGEKKCAACRRKRNNWLNAGGKCLLVLGGFVLTLASKGKIKFK